ncbi:MAG TPA: exodeoxyribonuclease VII large subunit [Erysipelotrichaceae bacterium]|nr:exodeoxyribonuclease VII large subunit [Erysipelotrichaceae bacterium]
MLEDRPVLTVTAVNQYIKSIINRDDNLKYLYVKGEISNFKLASNGHFYFSLKDDKSLIGAMMFASYANKISFNPENGQEVVILGSIDVYPPRGTYQIIVYQMEEVGAGAALLELEKLKKKLLAEGLFDESRKRQINLYPKAIGVISAPNSAAIKDILTNLKRRYPVADVYVFYSAVQGENAAKELLNAFNIAQQYPLDTLLIGRGGGASEDLSAFNDEDLVRAVAYSKMPVIACVGHEIDTTLVDYAADKRASTPTGAAELATIDRREIEQRLSFALQDMQESLINRLKRMKDDVLSYQETLDLKLRQLVSHYQEIIKHKALALETLNPENVIKRGYSLTIDEKGRTITSLKEVEKGQKIKTIVKDGIISSEVLDMEEKSNGKKL